MQHRLVSFLASDLKVKDHFLPPELCRRIPYDHKRLLDLCNQLLFKNCQFDLEIIFIYRIVITFHFASKYTTYITQVFHAQICF